MRRLIIPAFAGLVLATMSLSSVALADSITVDFGQGSYNWGAGTLSGPQVTSTAKNGDLSGTYVASGGSFGSDFCLHGVTTKLQYPATQSGVTLLVDKFCFNSGFSGSFSVIDHSGSGAFGGASGGGSVVYNRPDDVTFNDTHGTLDPIRPGSTPELDSVVLFGTGLLGLGGYAVMRVRARRKRASE